ncbi:MAG: hypothetical protein JO033_20270 [Acidobacteriaceae bacterium]|nr:hypothetical protein [Acidobacteriaceae bacterium]
MLVDPDKHKVVEGLTPEQVAKMEKEMEVLQRELALIEESHGNQVLNLVLARGYVASCSAMPALPAILANIMLTSIGNYRRFQKSSSLEN